MLVLRSIKSRSLVSSRLRATSPAQPVLLRIWIPHKDFVGGIRRKTTLGKRMVGLAHGSSNQRSSALKSGNFSIAFALAVPSAIW